MNIPTSYQLAGNTWTVHFKSKKEMKTDYGCCYEENNEIWIYNRLGHAKRMQAFIHESAHAVLFTLGYLEHDERMVEAVAQLVYQLFITREYDGEEMGSAERSSKSDAGSTTGACCGLHSDDDCGHKSDRRGAR